MQTFSPNIDQYQAAATLAQALADLVKNPSVIKDITKNALEASRMSDERLEEVQATTLATEENKRTTAHLLQTMGIHKTEVESARKEFEQRENDLKEKIEAHQNNVKVTTADLARKSVDVKQLNEAVLKRSKEVEIKEQDITQRELTCKAIVDAVAKREMTCESREQTLQDAIVKLEARKKKFAEAAKED